MRSEKIILGIIAVCMLASLVSSIENVQELLSTYSFDYVDDGTAIANIADFMADTNGDSVNDALFVNFIILTSSLEGKLRRLLDT